MCLSYSHQQNILASAKNLLSNSVGFLISEMRKINNEGTRTSLYRCNGCNKEFKHEQDESTLVFLCGHKYHYECAEYHEHLECIVCSKNEVELAVTNPNINMKKSLFTKDFSLLGLGNQTKNINRNKIITEKKTVKEMLEHKLRGLDKMFLERNSVIIIF